MELNLGLKPREETSTEDVSSVATPGCSRTYVYSVSKFTINSGSTSTGKAIMRSAAQHVAQVTLELGGKSPLIIFEDSDISEAVKGTMAANFYSQGAVCSNAARVYVHKAVLDEFIDRLVTSTNKLVVGNPLEEGTHVGAIINKAHMEKVVNYIEGAKREGGTVLCGGEALACPGYFLSPCVILCHSDGMTAVKEEIFGQVVTVLPFEDEQEVVKRANDTPFGLAAGIFTRDLQRAHRVAAHLQAGFVWVNNYNVYPAGTPFGGVKQSGFGRENSEDCVNNFTQLKTVYVELGTVDSPYRD